MIRAWNTKRHEFKTWSSTAPYGLHGVEWNTLLVIKNFPHKNFSRIKNFFRLFPGFLGTTYSQSFSRSPKNRANYKKLWPCKQGIMVVEESCQLSRFRCTVLPSWLMFWLFRRISSAQHSTIPDVNSTRRSSSRERKKNVWNSAFRTNFTLLYLCYPTHSIILTKSQVNKNVTILLRHVGKPTIQQIYANLLYLLHTGASIH